jgi:hypothetical protein
MLLVRHFYNHLYPRTSKKFSGKKYIEENNTHIMAKEISKFSVAEMTSNDDGKTSGSGTVGIVISFVGGLCFLLGSVDKMFLSGTVDILTQSIVVIGIGVGLLGYRKGKSTDAKIAESSPTEEK